MAIAKNVYCVTKVMPQEEVFGLTSQIKRAAVSVPSNISEGRSRNSKKEFCHFLHIALGSLSELETQLLLAKEIYNISEIDNTLNQVYEERRMISGMLKRLKSSKI